MTERYLKELKDYFNLDQKGSTSAKFSRDVTLNLEMNLIRQLAASYLQRTQSKEGNYYLVPTY